MSQVIIDELLKRRYEDLDTVMQMYFREKTFIKAWDISADKRNKEAKDYNSTKHWWQRKKLDNFPHYDFCPVPMPRMFIVPPFSHPQLKETELLIADYVKSGDNLNDR